MRKGRQCINVRKADFSDLEGILSIYSYARAQMKRNGNPDQWGEDRPSAETVKKDIRDGNLYVIEQQGNLGGVFAFIIGEEPAYQEIEGEWLNDQPYGTVHRVAKNGKINGVLEICIEYCGSLIKNIRIDTHKKNAVMRYLLQEYEFRECGTIYVEDKTPRIAYQKEK